jgi:glutathione S-transferase
MVLKIYGDYVSDVCRAVFAFCKLANIEFEYQYVELFAGQNKTPEFLAVNP